MTQIFKCFLIVATTFSFTALADISPVQQNTKAFEVAVAGANIHWVENFKFGKLAFKAVNLDSELNGDIASTLMLYVGHSEVGGAAGYDHAFQLTPTDEFAWASDFKAANGVIKVTYGNIEGKRVTKRYKYDGKAGILKELK